MEYDSELGKLTCDSCGHTQNIEEAPEIEQEETIEVELFDGSKIPNETEVEEEAAEDGPIREAVGDFKSKQQCCFTRRGRE